MDLVIQSGDSFRAFPKSDTESPFPKRALLSCKIYNQMVQVQAVLDLMTIQPQSSVAKWNICEMSFAQLYHFSSFLNSKLLNASSGF